MAAPHTPHASHASAKVPNDYTLRLTKYERVHVVGMRAEQLARGMQAFVPLPEPVRGASANDLFYDIAERELDQHKLPFIVVRQLLDGTAMHIRTSARGTSVEAPPPRASPRSPASLASLASSDPSASAASAASAASP